MGRSSAEPIWARYRDEQLLDLRLYDLGVTLEGSDVEPAVRQLHQELAGAGVRFRPHAWLSDEWFTPDGVPGIAIPFYLAHPRLRKLEQSQMLEVEGGTHDWCMRILRHEAGHALDNGYRLHRKQAYRNLFGSWHEPYPDSYRPRPNAKRFVVHLDLFYAQSHPAEDFAETFAVWLNPASQWRTQYAKWPALTKLDYVNELMTRIGSTLPPVQTRRRTHPMRLLRMTLREHYARRRQRSCRSAPGVLDRDLRRIFGDAGSGGRSACAGEFVESIRDELRTMVSRWTGASGLTIDRSIADMVLRIRSLGLRLRKPPHEAKVNLMMMLAVQTTHYLNDGRNRVML